MDDSKACLQIMDVLPTMVWKTDPRFRCDYLNKAWLSFTGMTTETASGYGWLKAFHSADREEAEKVCVIAFQSRKPYEVEHRMIRYDGEIRYVVSTGAPYYNEDGSFAGYIGSVFDVTDIKKAEEERRKTEEALRISEEKFRQLFHNSSSAIFVQELDEKGLPSRFIEINDTACREWGYTREEFLNIDPYRDHIYDHFENLEELIKTYNENDHVTFEFSGMSKKGFHKNVVINSHKFSLSGKSVLLSIVTDISRQKEAELLIKKSEKKYQDLLMNMDRGFAYFKIISTEDNKKDLLSLEVNSAFCKIVELQEHQIVDKTIKEVLPDLSPKLDESVNFLYQLANQEQGYWCEAIYLKDIDKWCSVFVYSPEGGYIAAILSDITKYYLNDKALKKAKEEAEAANKAKSEFLANMSHEIRTPINGIVGMIDLTMMSQLDEDQKDNLNIAKSCANTLLRLINDILDFSKLEARKLIIEAIPFDLKDLVEDIIKVHSASANDKKIELNYMFAANVPHNLIGDPNRLRQILSNLIHNAIKFTSIGSVTLMIKRNTELEDKNDLLFSVADTGIGIGPEDMGRLFQTFTQVDGSVTRKYGGTGLGLAISKQLVEIMGGKMRVESALGKGSVFYFSLPFEIDKKPTTKPPAPKTEMFVKPLDILLVEDDIINQIVTKRMLKQLGFSVDISNNGKEALEMVQLKKYDLILMDVQMPEMDGLEATRRIREYEGEECHTPIIALTAHAIQGDKERFLSLGMDEYLSKPVQMVELFDMIKSVVNQRHNQGWKNPKIIFNELGDAQLVDQEEEATEQDYEDYIKQANNLIRELYAAVNERDFISVERISNKLKELFERANSYLLKSLAFKIELSIRRGNLQEAVEYTLQLSDEFERFCESHKKEGRSLC